MHFIKLHLIGILPANIFKSHLVFTYKEVPGSLISALQKRLEDLAVNRMVPAGLKILADDFKDKAIHGL